MINNPQTDATSPHLPVPPAQTHDALVKYLWARREALLSDLRAVEEYMIALNLPVVRTKERRKLPR